MLIGPLQEQFIQHCVKGELQIAQELFATKRDTDLSKTIFVFNENPANERIRRDACIDAFTSACFHGQLQVAVWLHSVIPNIDLDTFNGCFKRACGNSLKVSHLSVAQWLHSVQPNIDMEAYNNGFLRACYYRHIDVAIWLLYVKPNVCLSPYELYQLDSNAKKAVLDFQQSISTSYLVDCFCHKNIDLFML